MMDTMNRGVNTMGNHRGTILCRGHKTPEVEKREEVLLPKRDSQCAI